MQYKVYITCEVKVAAFSGQLTLDFHERKRKIVRPKTWSDTETEYSKLGFTDTEDKQYVESSWYNINMWCVNLNFFNYIT